MSRSQNQRILLIEDDRKVADFVERGLTEEGYQVDWARTGTDGINAATSSHPDLVLLDLRLPDVFGVDVCRQLRRKFPALPILMLTALDAVKDRVAGLEAGADDYLPKPFAFDELVARISALLRRARLGPDSHVLSDGTVELNIDSRECTVGRESVKLSPTEFDLLAYLISRSGQAVHRDDALSAVWSTGDDAIPNVVDVYVGYLRKKLAAAGSQAKLESVRGVGYRYVPEASSQ
jgi:two-component system OmpR family response regulator/two-component system response regulator MprA